MPINYQSLIKGPSLEKRLKISILSILCLAGLLFSFGYSIQHKRHIKQLFAHQFEKESNNRYNNIKKEFDFYEQKLKALVGLFRSSSHVNESELKNFVESIRSTKLNTTVCWRNLNGKESYNLYGDLVSATLSLCDKTKLKTEVQHFSKNENNYLIMSQQVQSRANQKGIISFIIDINEISPLTTQGDLKYGEYLLVNHYDLSLGLAINLVNDKKIENFSNLVQQGDYNRYYKILNSSGTTLTFLSLLRKKNVVFEDMWIHYLVSILGALLAFSISIIGFKLMVDKEKIAKKVEEQTIQIQQSYEELKKQKSMTFHKSRLASLGELAAGVGHEINNPLAILSGYSKVLQKMFADNKFDIEAAKQRVVKMDSAIERIAKIVKGLRVFARVDASDQETFDLNLTLVTSVELLNDIYLSEGIDLIFENEGDEQFWVHADEGKIQQVIMNIISNAKDSTANNSESREIRVNLEKENGQAILRITDNGPGIPKEVQEKMFDPFFTTKPVNKGTGIGLAIVKSILEDSEGSIEFETAENQGTTFIIKIKLTDKEIVNKCPGESLATSGKPYAGLKAVVVDDEEEIAEFMGEYLKDLGFEVIVYSSPELALTKIQNLNLALIISDVKMPEMNGLTFVKKVSQIVLNNPKVLYMTGGLINEDQNLRFLIDSDNANVLQKPFTETELQQAIFNIMPDQLTKNKKKAS